MFKFGNEGGNDSRLGVKSLSNTYAKCVTIGRKSTAKCQWWRCPSPGYHGKSRRLQVWWSFKMNLCSGWSTDLCQLPELNFIQLYDYLVVSTRKYRHIVLKGTNYKKLKSYQFFFEGNVKMLETKTHENNIENIELTPQCDILLASSSFFLFHDIKSHCSEESTSQETKKKYIYIYLTVILRGRAGYEMIRPSWLLSAHIRQVREE